MTDNILEDKTIEELVQEANASFGQATRSSVAGTMPRGAGRRHEIQSRRAHKACLRYAGDQDKHSEVIVDWETMRQIAQVKAKAETMKFEDKAQYLADLTLKVKSGELHREAFRRVTEHEVPLLRRILELVKIREARANQLQSTILEGA